MTITGTHPVAAEPGRVFDCLVDAAILQQAIPGCEKLEKTGEDEYTAHLRLGIGSIKGSYTGKVRLTDRTRPHGFTMHLEGKGGPGFVKGTCVIELVAAVDGATKLQYSADAQVGGLIAAIGSRVIEVTAKKMAGDFFVKFASLVCPGAKPKR